MSPDEITAHGMERFRREQELRALGFRHSQIGAIIKDQDNARVPLNVWNRVRFNARMRGGEYIPMKESRYVAR